MKITRTQIRKIIREAVANDDNRLIDGAMAHIEAAAAMCMQLGDYQAHPRMTERGAKLATIHRALATASLGLESIGADLASEEVPSAIDPDLDVPL